MFKDFFNKILNKIQIFLYNLFTALDKFAALSFTDYFFIQLETFGDFFHKYLWIILNFFISICLPIKNYSYINLFWKIIHYFSNGHFLNHLKQVYNFIKPYYLKYVFKYIKKFYKLSKNKIWLVFKICFLFFKIAKIRRLIYLLEQYMLFILFYYSNFLFLFICVPTYYTYKIFKAGQRFLAWKPMLAIYVMGIAVFFFLLYLIALAVLYRLDDSYFRKYKAFVFTFNCWFFSFIAVVGSWCTIFLRRYYWHFEHHWFSAIETYVLPLLDIYTELFLEYYVPISLFFIPFIIFYHLNEVFGFPLAESAHPIADDSLYHDWDEDEDEEEEIEDDDEFECEFEDEELEDMTDAEVFEWREYVDDFYNDYCTPEYLPDRVKDLTPNDEADIDALTLKLSKTFQDDEMKSVIIPCFMHMLCFYHRINPFDDPIINQKLLNFESRLILIKKVNAAYHLSYGNWTVAKLKKQQARLERREEFIKNLKKVVMVLFILCVIGGCYMWYLHIDFSDIPEYIKKALETKEWPVPKRVITLKEQGLEEVNAPAPKSKSDPKLIEFYKKYLMQGKPSKREKKWFKLYKDTFPEPTTIKIIRKIVQPIRWYAHNNPKYIRAITEEEARRDKDPTLEKKITIIAPRYPGQPPRYKVHYYRKPRGSLLTYLFKQLWRVISRFWEFGVTTLKDLLNKIIEKIL